MTSARRIETAVQKEARVFRFKNAGPEVEDHEGFPAGVYLLDSEPCSVTAFTSMGIAALHPSYVSSSKRLTCELRDALTLPLPYRAIKTRMVAYELLLFA